MADTISTYGLYIKKINDLLAKKANQALQAHNLTMSQAQMLMMLYQWGQDSYSLKELESLFHVAQSTMAGLASRLERKGLIISLHDSVDRRVKIIRLTEAGRALCLAAKLEIDLAEQRLVACLTPEEKVQFLHMLQRVYGALKG